MSQISKPAVSPTPQHAGAFINTTMGPNGPNIVSPSRNGLKRPIDNANGIGSCAIGGARIVQKRIEKIATGRTMLPSKLR